MMLRWVGIVVSSVSHGGGVLFRAVLPRTDRQTGCGARQSIRPSVHLRPDVVMGFARRTRRPHRRQIASRFLPAAGNSSAWRATRRQTDRSCHPEIWFVSLSSWNCLQKTIFTRHSAVSTADRSDIVSFRVSSRSPLRLLSHSRFVLMLNRAWNSQLAGLLV